MQTTTLHIKNMVCDRCKMAVDSVLRNAGLRPISIELGVAEVEGVVTVQAMEAVDDAMRRLGFELLHDRKSQTVERIRTAVMEFVRHGGHRDGLRLSAFVADRLCSDYSALSKLFSECTGMTIERFCILQRIERAKELLSYDEMNVSEIATALGYPNSAHFSSQFKAITGQTPTQFKAAGGRRLNTIDSI